MLSSSAMYMQRPRFPVAPSPSLLTTPVNHRADAWAALAGNDDANAVMDQPQYTPDSSAPFSTSRPNSLMPAPLRQNDVAYDIPVPSAEKKCSPVASTNSSICFSLPREGSYAAGNRTSRSVGSSDTGYCSPSFDEQIMRRDGEPAQSLLYSARELCIASILNRVLLLYYNCRYDDALSLVDEAYQQQSMREEPSFSSRIALWKAVILDKFGNGLEVISTLPDALRLYQGDNSTDLRRLMKLLRKYAIGVDMWLKINHSEDGANSSEANFGENMASAILEDLEERFSGQKSPRSWVNSRSDCDNAYQPRNILDQSLNEYPESPANPFKVPMRERLQSAERSRQSCNRCTELYAENQSLRRVIACTPRYVNVKDTESLESHDSTFEDLLADVQINRPVLTDNYTHSPLKNSPCLTDIVNNLKYGDGSSRHNRGHELPYRRKRIEDTSLGSESDTHDGSFVTGSTSANEEPIVQFRTDILSLREHHDNARNSQIDVADQLSTSSGIDLYSSKSGLAKRDITDTPGGEELTRLAQEVAVRRNSTERRKSLPVLMINTQHDTEFSKAKGRSFSVDTTSPITPSPLRESSKRPGSRVEELESD